jgi:hypothetical protein
MFHVEHFCGSRQNAPALISKALKKIDTTSLERGPRSPFLFHVEKIDCGKSGSILRQITVSEAE